METQQELSRAEVTELACYLEKLADEIPKGLPLKSTILFAILDLTTYGGQGLKGKDFYKALFFARSIPRFDDFDSDECAAWMINDVEHLKYWE